MALMKNQDIDLFIESYTSEGSGVGHYDGMAVFVSGAAAGDTVKAHIIKAKKSYAIGKIAKINNPSKDRIAVDCDVFPSCGGCTFRHVDYSSELKMKKKKVEDAFLRLGGIDIKASEIIGAQETLGYRNKAEYPVGFSDKAEIGFYSQRTHRIIDTKECLLQPHVFSEIVSVFRKWITEFGISVYDSETNKGVLRHIYIRQGTASKEIMVCAVANSDKLPKSDVLVERLTKLESIKSIVLNINKENTNVILSDKCVTLWGEDYIYDTLCGVKIRLSPLSFYQVNHDQAEKLYRRAKEYADIDGSQTVLDMYCGAGTIGLSMSDRAKKIIGVEIVSQAVEDAKVNAQLNGIDNAEFYCMDAAEASVRLKDKGIKPDVIVLDPPRKGCERALVETVAEMNPERIVYVSCDPATLARDCAVFKELGYNVQKLTAVDLFPRTVHVESVALLTK